MSEARTSRESGHEKSIDQIFPVVGIGASAGGLEAFTQLLSQLPKDTGMAFVLVQHLDPEHESALTQILSRVAPIPVAEATNDLKVEPDNVYVIPPNTSLNIVAGVLKLEPRPRTRMPHRSIDTFFESLAQDRGEAAIGVVLSGTATDGTLGLEAIKAEGGITFAQDASAKHESMPRSAIAAGCVDLVLSPAEIARELGEIARHPFGVGRPLDLPSSAEENRAEATAREDDESPLPSGGRGAPRTDAAKARREARDADGGDRKLPNRSVADYKKILLLLRNHSGVDFSLYKSTTIQRRITRRLVLSKQQTLEEYTNFLRGNARELDALYSDVLISVTSFFRNPEAFEVLQRVVLPTLMKQGGDEPLRCWVLGCSTGQEAYSIAMSFVEMAEKRTRLRQMQIFATDLNESLLDKARHGLYAKSLVADLSPQRLRRFFNEEAGGYRIAKPLRDMVVFARQNLISDPPFSRMDLISCRNLLIYLEPSLQQKAIPTFHYALKTGGYLLLGASESIGSFTELFEPIDKKYKVYSKKASQTPGFFAPARRTHGKRESARPPLALPMRSFAQHDLPDSLRNEVSAQREADRISVGRFAPPGVIINGELQVLQFRGPTGMYLEPPAGKATFNVLKMARDGLMLPLRTAINQARRDNKTVVKENVRIKQDGKSRAVNLEVIPLKNMRERSFLILFKESKRGESSGDGSSAAVPAATPRRSPRQESKHIAILETELAETREYLQSIQEQHEAANEELQAANEEVQSANEELQSINEELETSKEELESANEELITVNDEMANRNAELNRLNSDLVNLQSSARIAVLVVGRDLVIQRFSPEAEKRLDLHVADLGQPIGHLRHNLFVVNEEGNETLAKLEDISAEVISSVREQELQVRSKAGRWYSLRVRPYMTLDSKVDGAVLVLVDVDELKRAEDVIADARDYAENVISTLREPIVVLDKELRVESANRSFYSKFQVTPNESIGRPLYELGGGEWNIPSLRKLLREILAGRSSIDDFEVSHDFPHIGSRDMLLNASRIIDPQRKSERILLAFEDITRRKRGEDQLRQNAADSAEADLHKTEFLAMLAHELRNPLAPITNGLHIIRKASGNTELIRSITAVVQRQVQHLVSLVDDLLDVNRISQGKIRLRREQVELADAVHDAVETIRPFIDERGQELKVALTPEPIVVDADMLRLTQVVVNLLSNACKFTPKGGLIELNVERRHERAIIRIRDSGIGIARDQIPRIFEMFVQVDASLEREVRGLGIGLTLVKRLVEMHGGTVEARSAGLGGGSEFEVSLPIVADAQPHLSTESSSETSAVAVRRVLIVDDNVDAAETLARLLSLEGIETRTAFDGIAGLDAAAELRPGLVLLDIGLPKLNGFDVARRIRQQPWGEKMVLVALTGWGKPEDRDQSRAAGFNLHLIKPVNPKELLKVLAEVTSTQGTD